MIAGRKPPTKIWCPVCQEDINFHGRHTHAQSHGYKRWNHLVNDYANKLNRKMNEVRRV